MAKRIGLLRTEALVEGLKRHLTTGGLSFSGLSGISGQVASTVTAAASAAQLSEALICPVDSTDNAHKVKMFQASYPGQICIILNVDPSQSFIVRNAVDDYSFVTVPALAGAIMVSHTAEDDWYCCGVGS